MLLKSSYINADTENVKVGSRSQHSVWSKRATGRSLGLEKKPSMMYNMLVEESGSREGSNRRMPMRHKDSSQSYTKSSSTSAVGISPAEERERALTTVRDNARGPQTSMESPRLRGVHPSRTSSRDSSVSEERSMANSKAQKAPGQLSQDDLDILCKMTLEDYLSTNNAKETYDYMKIELPPANYVDFIQFSVEKVLETSTPVRQSVSRLLAFLISNQLFNKQLFVKGLNKVLAGAEELLLDVPMFWSYVADILGVMLEEEVILLSILQYFTSELPENLQGPLVIAVLNVLNKSKGPSWVNEKWAESGLHWKDLIPAKNVEKFVKDNGLDYIVDGSGHGQSKSGSISMEHVKEKVVILLKSSGSADAVFDWIEANVHGRTSDPSFIRALTTALFESAMENVIHIHCNIFCVTDSFKDPVIETAQKILQRYLSGDEKHELQCLYAIQALVYDLGHPKGLILKVFEFLHNHDVISIESFIAWEKSSDEPDGKAVALKSLTQFFTYLTEPEDDSAEEA
ncbi:hypothetical protein J437_LFUL018435 [Ladona fulva]|uniref:Uncharacterized protein n=1 Tax=Ladona fulva TaxID=123851 RepID=A0A8K0KRM7_LADFU|nr:hypothetical protein J437_LFUL018435 [Ladona fulva]